MPKSKSRNKKKPDSPQNNKATAAPAAVKSTSPKIPATLPNESLATSSYYSEEKSTSSQNTEENKLSNPSNPAPKIKLTPAQQQAFQDEVNEVAKSHIFKAIFHQAANTKETFLEHPNQLNLFKQITVFSKAIGQSLRAPNNPVLNKRLLDPADQHAQFNRMLQANMSTLAFVLWNRIPKELEQNTRLSTIARARVEENFARQQLDLIQISREVTLLATIVSLQADNNTAIEDYKIGDLINKISRVKTTTPQQQINDINAIVENFKKQFGITRDAKNEIVDVKGLTPAQIDLINKLDMQKAAIKKKEDSLPNALIDALSARLETLRIHVGTITVPPINQAKEDFDSAVTAFNTALALDQTTLDAIKREAQNGNALPALDAKIAEVQAAIDAKRNALAPQIAAKTDADNQLIAALTEGLEAIKIRVGQITLPAINQSQEEFTQQVETFTQTLDQEQAKLETIKLEAEAGNVLPALDAKIAEVQAAIDAKRKTLAPQIAAFSIHTDIQTISDQIHADLNTLATHLQNTTLTHEILNDLSRQQLGYHNPILEIADRLAVLDENNSDKATLIEAHITLVDLEKQLKDAIHAAQLGLTKTLSTIDELKAVIQRINADVILVELPLITENDFVQLVKKGNVKLSELKDELNGLENLILETKKPDSEVRFTAEQHLELAALIHSTKAHIADQQLALKHLEVEYVADLHNQMDALKLAIDTSQITLTTEQAAHSGKVVIEKVLKDIEVVDLISYNAKFDEISKKITGIDPRTAGQPALAAQRDGILKPALIGLETAVRTARNAYDLDLTAAKDEIIALTTEMDKDLATIKANTVNDATGAMISFTNPTVHLDPIETRIAGYQARITEVDTFVKGIDPRNGEQLTVIRDNAKLQPQLEDLQNALAAAKKLTPTPKMDFHHLRMLLDKIADRVGITGNVDAQTTAAAKFIQLHDNIENALQIGDAEAFERAKNNLRNQRNPSFEEVMEAMHAFSADLDRVDKGMDPPDPTTNPPDWHVAQWTLFEKYRNMEKIINNIIDPTNGKLTNLDFSLMDRTEVVDKHDDVNTWLANNVPGTSLAAAGPGFLAASPDGTQRNRILLDSQKSISVFYLDKNNDPSLASRQAKKESAICMVTERQQNVLKQTVTVSDMLNPHVILTNAAKTILQHGIKDANLPARDTKDFISDMLSTFQKEKKLYTAKNFEEYFIKQTHLNFDIKGNVKMKSGKASWYNRKKEATPQEILAITLEAAFQKAMDPKKLLSMAAASIFELMQRKGLSVNEWAGKNLEISNITMGPAAAQALADFAAYHKIDLVTDAYKAFVGNPSTVQSTIDGLKGTEQTDFKKLMIPKVELPAGAPIPISPVRASIIGATPPPVKVHTPTPPLLALHAASDPTPLITIGQDDKEESKSGPSSPSTSMRRGSDSK